MKIVFKGKTFDGNDLEFNIKYIDNIHLNFVTVKTSYKNWLDTGELKNKEYELTPESLSSLIDLIENNRKICNVSVESSKAFLRKFPTLKSMTDYLEKIKKLPVDKIKTY